MNRVPETGPSDKDRNLEIALGFCLLVSLATSIQSVSRDLGILGMAGGIAFGMAFLAIPYLIAYFGGRLLRSKALRLVSIFLMFAALGWWLFIWYATFVDNSSPDAQDGLIIIFAPLYSGAAVFMGCVGLKVMDRWGCELCNR